MKGMGTFYFQETRGFFMVRAIVVGAGERITKIISLAFFTDGIELAGVIEREGHPLKGKDIGMVFGLGKTGIVVEDDFAASLQDADVMIDFSPNEVAIDHLRVAAEKNIPVVIATRGFSETEMMQVRSLSEKTKCTLIPNITGDDVYAKRAIRAALWVVHQKRGLYDLQDILS
jgi:4-hydroxy-tetrahydrodipicolinate reductase